MNNRIVSVIIPCYNGEAVIDRSIKSVYDQSCEFKIELIVVDDGSTDQSRQKINRWMPLFKKKNYVFKYIYQENQGLGGAINTGLKYVTGKYLTLLDADDCFLPGSFGKRIDFLEDHVDFTGVRTNGWIEKDNKQKLFVYDEKEKKNTNLFDGLIGGGSVNWAGSYLIRTEVLFDFYPEREIYPSRFGQNMQLLLPVSYKNKFGFIDEPLMVYYMQNNSLSQASTKDEQIEKDNFNFYGYYDIYLYMLDLVVHDDEEYAYYLNIVTSWKFRHELKMAMINDDKKKAAKYFGAYKATGCMTNNEKIEYYSKFNPIKAFCLKVDRRIRVILKTMSRNCKIRKSFVGQKRL